MISPGNLTGKPVARKTEEKSHGELTFIPMRSLAKDFLAYNITIKENTYSPPWDVRY